MRRRLHRDSPVPVWAQIEEALAARIGGGELKVGDRLPAERELADELHVSRGTIRQALDALAARGLVERGVGRGTFVAAGKVEVRLHDVAGFTEQMARAGLQARARVLNAGTKAAPEPVAAALGLEAGAPVVRIERLRLAGRLPLTLEDSWIPSARFPGIEELDLRGSIYQLMSDLYDHAPVRVVESLEPVVAQAHSAELLGVAAGSPLMLVERTAFDADGVAVEYARDLHRGDRARFVVEAAAPQPVS
jgi:GntR family transcriptional regulator